MDPAVQRMADALVTAIRAEIEGQHFYRMAARATEDVQGRQVFEALAREEEEHAEVLRKQHAALLEHGQADPALALGKPGVLDGSSPIFSAQVKARAREAHFEMTALSVGAQLEASAIAFYQRAAADATDPVLAALLGRLADWESTHYHALLRQQEALRADYWAGSGFAPF
jgi:rubrerythrin